MNCLLCRRRPADQTGSHIVSAFLLTSQIGKRGQEQAFLISTNPKQDYSENKGDSGIKEDYIFCRECEKRLSFIENYYSAEITHKIEDPQFNQNFPKSSTKHGEYVRCLRIDPIAFTLLIQSNIWRASLSTKEIYAHFKLPADVEEDLRFQLDLFLPETVDHKITISLNTWIKTVRNCVDYFKFFPYLILKAEGLSNKEVTFQFFDSVSHQPNEIILNEYIILPFFGSDIWKDNFFEFKDELDASDLMNNKYAEIKIGILTNARFMQLIDKIQDLASDQRVRNTYKECIEEFRAKGIPFTLFDIEMCKQAKVNSIKIK